MPFCAYDGKPNSVIIDLHAALISCHAVMAIEQALLAAQTASLMPQADLVSWKFSNQLAETAVVDENASVGLVRWKSRQLAYDDGAYSVDVYEVHGQCHDASRSVLGRLPLVIVSATVKVDHVGVLNQVVQQSAGQMIDGGSTITM